MNLHDLYLCYFDANPRLVREGDGIFFSGLKFIMARNLSGYYSVPIIFTGYHPFNLPVERDLYFTPRMTLSEYAQEAQKLGRIVS